MTDHDETLDERASAHLDGAGAPEQPGDDPELAARVEEFRTIRELIRDPVEPPDPARRSAAIAAALAAFDDAAPVPAGATPPDELARRARTRRGLQLVGAAAAVALVALIIPFVDRLDSGSSSDDLAAGTKSDAATRQEAVAGAASPTSTTSAAELRAADAIDLGSFDAVPQLADAVRTRLSGPYTAAQPTAADSQRSFAALCTTAAEDGSVVFTAFATLEGRAVAVLVREVDGGRSLVVLDRSTCETISAGRL